MRCPVLAGSTTFQYYSQAPARSVSRQGVLRQSGTRKKEKMTTNLFRMTHFRKNASVTPFVSHTFKTKDLKSFRITHFQKKGGGYPMTTIAIPKWDSHSCLPTSGRRQHHIARPI